MPADPVDAVVAAFRAEGMKGDDELVERFARVAVETCERDTVRLVGVARRFVDAWWEFDGLPWQTHYNSVADHVVALDRLLAEFEDRGA